MDREEFNHLNRDNKGDKPVSYVEEIQALLDTDNFHTNAAERVEGCMPTTLLELAEKETRFLKQTKDRLSKTLRSSDAIDFDAARCIQSLDKSIAHQATLNEWMDEHVSHDPANSNKHYFDQIDDVVHPKHKPVQPCISDSTDLPAWLQRDQQRRGKIETVAEQESKPHYEPAVQVMRDLFDC